MAAGDKDTKLSAPKFSSFKPKPPAGNSDARLDAPKFSSFKPKAPTGSSDAGLAERKDESKGESDRGIRESKHRSRSEHRKYDGARRDTNRQRREEERRDQQRDEHTRHRTRDPKPASAPDSVSSVPGLFVIDKKGDPLIRKYGLDRSKIPSYHRYGGNRVLGTDGRLFIHRDGPTDKFSLLFPGDGPSRSREKSGLRSRDWLKREPVKFRAPRHQAVQDDDAGYLSLQNPRKRHGHHRDSDSSDGDDQPSWRSIEGKAKAARDKDNQDSDEEESDSPADGPELNNPLQWKSKQLNRQVKDHPDDIDAWLELVDHQDALLRNGETIDDRAADTTAHSFAEIKVHLLESALAHASGWEDRQRVLVGLMREGVKVWSRNVAVKKWSQISADEHRSFALWKTHLDFCMSSIATFQYEDIKKMMLDRLQRVVSRSGLQAIQDVGEAIYIFLRATRFFYEAGYQELAVAAWQGLLELNLFRPEGIQGQKETVAAFQEFWESEVPRIGDAGAQGWKHYVESGGFGDAPDPVLSEEPPAATRPRDVYHAWGAAERLAGKKAAMPARTMDADVDDDPFRIIMHSDLEPWLFALPKDSSANATHQLVDAWLLFTGLPPAFRSSDRTEEAYCDQFLVRARACLEPLQPPRDVNAAGEGVPTRRPPSFGNGNCRARMSTDLLFGGDGWFQYFDVSSNEHVVDLAWVEATLKQIVHQTNASSLALYYLGLCAARKPDQVRKPAKALLKRYPAEVELYNAYALAEFANGNVEVANKVLASALESPALASADTGFLLFKSWSWIELQKGNKRLATKRLCACLDGPLRGPILDDSEASPAAILAARQSFASNMQQYLYEGKQEIASHHMACLALLSYLTGRGGSEPSSTGQGNVSEAMAAIGSMTGEIESRGLGGGRAHELILQFASRLLYLHSTTGPFRRAYMGEQLARYVGCFPQNTVFLNLFGWADAKMRVIDETRQLLYDKVLVRGHDSVSSRMFAVQHELESGNGNTTRAAFEHAVSSEACKCNATLWIQYVRFCWSQRTLRAKARDVLYRALGHCPWSKQLMMEAFGTLAGDMESDEMRSVYKTMTSKGLRIHVDLDEHVEEDKRHEARR
ncbi:hypothetical protein CDD83_8432 [Cordyceps sp. RAO-2017]|nr:hypothetical protein CDD83_8432 [Cordyceps sp. RAO-2017]